MIKTIIFDLDDTLYDELDYCRSGFLAVAKFLASKLGSPSAAKIFKILWNCFKTSDRLKVFNTALEKLNIPYNETFIKKLVKIYRNHKPAIKLPAESKKVLNNLAASYDLALITDGFLPAQKLKVKALRIQKYFRTIIYTEELGREHWKPSPLGFQKIMSQLKSQPDQIIYVADNAKKDFIAPNKLGFITVQISRPKALHITPPPNSQSAAKYKIKKLTQLIKIL